MLRFQLATRPRHVLDRLRTPQLASIARHKTSQADREQQEAREWVRGLDAHTIPLNLAQVTYSRSSGPGGQHVNTTNSKATLRLPLDKIRPPVVPALVHAALARSRYYAKNSGCLLIQTDASRSQRDNLEACRRKLCQNIKDVAAEVLRGETSPEQRARVQEL